MVKIDGWRRLSYPTTFLRTRLYTLSVRLFMAIQTTMTQDQTEMPTAYFLTCSNSGQVAAQTVTQKTKIPYSTR